VKSANSCHVGERRANACEEIKMSKARMDELFAKFYEVADRPLAYGAAWKEANRRMIVGSFPMNFPAEMAHAAGTLPMILQESKEQITVGHGLLFPFYCGYTRSVTDQAAKGDFGLLDALLFGDHCVQLLGAADSIRLQLPNTRVCFFQLISSMCDPWSMGRARETFVGLKAELEDLVGQPVSDDALRSSIVLFNKNRQMLRYIYDLRKSGRVSISARQMQTVVKSSMMMDKAEHNALLERLIVQLDKTTLGVTNGGIRVHLSGHFCQAPNLELLDMIESCGATVADDDLYHGYRYISTDVDEDGDPLDALAKWYLARNTGVPCPTRVQNNIDWDAYLVKAVESAQSLGVVVLMAKFCEPHMYYYPELKEAFEKHDIPHLLIETEHEAMPLEAMKTRVETFVEIIKRKQTARDAANA
jgi:benzoyl-CoA reductase subunit C